VTVYVGPGNDWPWVVTWRLRGPTAIGSAIYQLDVSPDGRYRAAGDGPQEVNGCFLVCTPRPAMCQTRSGSSTAPSIS
jgi:ABC-2 type transport system permease protein